VDKIENDFGNTDRYSRKNVCETSEMISEVTEYVYYSIILTNISIILIEIYELYVIDMALLNFNYPLIIDDLFYQALTIT